MRLIAKACSDAEAFLSALAAGGLDACLAYLRREGGSTDSDAGLNCRLAEALFHHGRRDEALECARRAFPWAGGDTAMLHICAWVFSNCRSHVEAASCYHRLTELCPEAIEFHRHASGSLAAIGRLDEAIVAGSKASHLAPDDPEFARHVGSLLLAVGRYEEAAFYLDRAVALEPDNAGALCELSTAYRALGRGEAAIALALRAATLKPDDCGITIQAAELLIACGRATEATELLHNAAAVTADAPEIVGVLVVGPIPAVDNHHRAPPLL